MKIWTLRIVGLNPWLRSVKNHIGRQVWEFDPEVGMPDGLMEIEKARESFFAEFIPPKAHL